MRFRSLAKRSEIHPREVVNSKKVRTVKDISKVFAKLVFQGMLSAAIKLLHSVSSKGLLNLTPDVLEGL